MISRQTKLKKGSVVEEKAWFYVLNNFLGEDRRMLRNPDIFAKIDGVWCIVEVKEKTEFPRVVSKVDGEFYNWTGYDYGQFIKDRDIMRQHNLRILLLHVNSRNKEVYYQYLHNLIGKEFQLFNGNHDKKVIVWRLDDFVRGVPYDA